MSALLQDGKILARPHEVNDVDGLLEAVEESVAELSPWLPWCHSGITKSELARFVEMSRAGWADGSQYQFALLDVESGAFLGGISLAHVVRTNRLANMGYWVRSSATGRGVASRAVKLVARYGFEALGLSRIEIAIVPSNRPSCRVAERAGAKFETVARNRLVMHGQPYDAVLYSLVPRDIVG
jgi:ribosomal-protein-serine acetyltransferase